MTDKTEKQPAKPRGDDAHEQKTVEHIKESVQDTPTETPAPDTARDGKAYEQAKKAAELSAGPQPPSSVEGATETVQADPDTVLDPKKQ